MLGAALLTACALSACASPPSKEINQAQGAIDAARAAGAVTYAEGAYQSATTALKLANDSVTQHDYRQALNYALESREHAQTAAREAAENRARIRAEVERTMTEIASLLAHAKVRLADAERARLPRQTLRAAREKLTQVNGAVQKAGAAIQADDYAAVQPALQGLKTQIVNVTASMDASLKSQSLRRRR